MRSVDVMTLRPRLEVFFPPVLGGRTRGDHEALRFEWDSTFMAWRGYCICGHWTNRARSFSACQDEMERHYAKEVA